MLDELCIDDVATLDPYAAVEFAYHFGVRADEVLDLPLPEAGPHLSGVTPLFVPDGWCTAA